MQGCRARVDDDGEQRLEWSTLHAEYCRLVEGKVEMRLKLIGATGDDLYRLLADVQGNDKRADSFLKKLLAMSDYLDFCEMMRWLGRIETRASYATYHVMPQSPCRLSRMTSRVPPATRMKSVEPGLASPTTADGERGGGGGR